jgi:hypothetical protein
MARYIDADKLLENLKLQYGEDLGWQCTVNMSDVGMMIEDAPTTDVVEVVRCKDCKYREDLNDRLNNIRVFCTLAVDVKEVDLTDYCSYGERREDNGGCNDISKDL